MSRGGPGDRIAPGSRVLIQDSRGARVELLVEQVDDGTIHVDAKGTAVKPGEEVMVEHCVPGDARYRTRAEVAADGRSGLRLLPTEGWERDNQRNFVRVRTYGLDVTVTRPWVEALEESERPKPDPYDMLDVSAGGAAIRTEPHFELGDEVVCHFELPDECCFALPARVVRVSDSGDEAWRSTIGVEFIGLDESHRSSLLRWIFREQARRRRPSR